MLEDLSAIVGCVKAFSSLESALQAVLTKLALKELFEEKSMRIDCEQDIGMTNEARNFTFRYRLSGIQHTRYSCTMTFTHRCLLNRWIVWCLCERAVGSL